jgi:two-component system phosphate regulon sensor histidine kinase PhoR
LEDNGIGIARDEQSRIFERFYQARNNNSPQKSIGIGLSLVKHIVTLHMEKLKSHPN